MTRLRTTGAHLLLTFASALAAACGDDSSEDGGAGGGAASSTTTTSSTSSAAATTGGQGGTGQGGAGAGQGGFGGAGGAGSGGASAAPATLELAFRNMSHGESWAIVAADLDGDDADEVVLGGRGVAAYDVASLATNAPRWALDWEVDGFSYVGGDNDWAYDVAALQIDADGVPDFVVSTSFLELIAISGADGSVLWRAPLEGSFPTALALFDGDDDGVRDVFAVGDAHGFSGATGAPLWLADVPDIIVFAKAAELDGEPGGELYVGVENDGIIGPGSGGGVVLPTLYGVNASGEVTFAYQAGDAVSALAVADLDADGRDEAIAASGFAVDVVGPDGDFLWGVTMPEGAYATEVAATVVDGAARLYVGVRDFDGGHRVDAYDDAGNVVWSHPLGKADGQPMNLTVTTVEGRAAPLLLVGSGGEFSPPTGALTALDLDDGAGERVVWREAAGLSVDAVTRGEVDGEDVTIFGGQSTIVHAVQTESGATVFDYTSGSFVLYTASGDLDGDGVSEAVTVDDHGNVRCVGPGGVERWTARIDVGGGGVGTGVAIADLDGDGAAEVVAGGWTYEPFDQRGVVDVWSGSGAPLRTLRTGAFVESVAAGDLDGDGAAEIVAVESSGPCTVHAWDGVTFSERFATPIEACFSALLALGDVDGAPGDEIAYADVQLFGDVHVALIGGDGDVAWSLTLPEIETFVAVDAGRILLGGASSEHRGHVGERSAIDGALVWQTFFAGRPDPQQEGSTVPGAVRAAAIVPDRDGDGVHDLAVGLATAELALVDGASGDVVWTEALEDPELVAADRHVVGGVAFIPAEDGLAASLVVGMGADLRSKASILAVDMDGVVHGALPTQGETHAITVGATATGRTRAYVGAGLDLWAVDLAPAP